MKKISLILGVLTLSALAFISCKKDDKAGTNGDMMSFTATIGGGAKTEINGLDMKWTGGEIIYINGEEFTGEKEGDGTTAVFTGETVDSPYEAYFLADYTKEGEYYKLPATQTYDGNNLSKVNPMYAESNTTDLQFHNICAMLELKVKGQGKVEKIVVTATDNQLLSGAFKVSQTTGGKYFAELIPENSGSKPMWWNGLGSSNTVTLDCGTSEELKDNEATTFYIALPQGNYTDLKLELKNGSVVEDTTFSMSFKAGQIRTKELTGVSVVIPTPSIPEGALKGKFTINSDGGKVYFSKGNLQYFCGPASDGKNWRFAVNQYDLLDDDPAAYMGHPSVGYSENSGEWIDLLGWGTSGQNHGATCCQPWNTDEDNSKYYAYNDQSKDLSDDNGSADWGYSYCSQEGKPAGTWRTPTGGDDGEWKYLLDTRATNYGESRRYACVKVNDLRGILMFPDDFSWPTTGAGDEPDVFNVFQDEWNNVNYNVDQFAVLEDAGCVFLPAAGARYGGNTRYVFFDGNYWSSSSKDDSSAYTLYFTNDVSTATYSWRYYGHSVRLVCDVK